MPDPGTRARSQTAIEAGTASHPRRSAELLWGTGERPSRGPKPGLTIDRIVAAAITVADAEGAAALSMRRVAAELGVGTMSLYRYLPGKTELLDLVLDRLSDPGEQVTHAAGKGWREVLAVMARGRYRLHLAHPWLVQVNWSRPVLGPNTLAGVELITAGLDGVGLTDQERLMVVVLVDSFVSGLVRNQVRSAADGKGAGDEEFWTQQYPVLEKVLHTGAYPALAALSADAFSVTWEETFEFGLRWLLDGIEALVCAVPGRVAGRVAGGVGGPGGCRPGVG